MRFRSSPNAPLAARHQPSGLTACLAHRDRCFTDYLAACRAMLYAAHQFSPNLEQAVAGNAPFELKPTLTHAKLSGEHKPYRRGIVLTHGLTDSPYFMRALGEFFAEQGFVVMAILLPGHGTQPGDLLKVHRQQWSETLTYAVNCLSLEVEQVYLGGLSTGATLSLQHCLANSQIRGLFLFSPALRITPLAAFAQLYCLTNWLLPRSAWVEIQQDRDLYKYESLTKNAVAQTYALIKNIQATLRQRPLNIPIFTALSNDDVTVDSRATLDLMAQTTHTSNKTVLYAKQQLNFAQKNIECVVMCDTQQHILSSAHTAIVLPDDDTHYGVTGEYANCTHYFPQDTSHYQACLKPTHEINRGEITAQNLQQGVLKRLMTNPKFSELKISLTQFIAGLD
jgi:esterase/lipase